MLFNRTDTERGYVANDIWHVTGFTDDGGIRFGRGEQEKILFPGSDEADRHIDLAYAVTVNGAQGASSPLAIGLAGTEGGRGRMASLESWYVTLSRVVTHLQLYTDDTAGWINKMERAEQRLSAHDLLHQQDDMQARTANWLLENAVTLDKTGLGRQVLNTVQLSGETMASFIGPGKKYPAPHMALPVWNEHGKERGVLLTEIRLSAEGRRLQLGDEQRLMGAGDAQFAGLQASRNGETLLAEDFSQALQLARDNPDSGVIIRLDGDRELLNAERLTGGKVNGNEPDVTLPVEEDTFIPLLPDTEQMAKADTELSAQQAARELMADLPDELQSLSALIPQKTEDKDPGELSVSQVAHETQMAIERVAAELDSPSLRNVAQRLQLQEREWVPEQEHDLEKSFED